MSKSDSRAASQDHAYHNQHRADWRRIKAPDRDTEHNHNYGEAIKQNSMFFGKW
jgi:hypothetical protein